MPLTNEEERIFKELRRKKDREYAIQRRNKKRIRKYAEKPSIRGEQNPRHRPKTSNTKKEKK